jgi:hypothetical protein
VWRVLPELECANVRNSCAREQSCEATALGLTHRGAGMRPQTDARSRHLVRVLRRLGGHLAHCLKLERAARPADKPVARVGLLAGARGDFGEADDDRGPHGLQRHHPPLATAPRSRRGGGAPDHVRRLAWVPAAGHAWSLGLGAGNLKFQAPSSKHGHADRSGPADRSKRTWFVKWVTAWTMW